MKKKLKMKRCQDYHPLCPEIIKVRVIYICDLRWLKYNGLNIGCVNKFVSENGVHANPMYLYVDANSVAGSQIVYQAPSSHGKDQFPYKIDEMVHAYCINRFFLTH